MMTDTIVERVRKLDTTSISDAMDKLGIECCGYHIKPVSTGLKICGRAFTVHSVPCGVRSEERRVGKDCRSRWSPYH